MKYELNNINCVHRNDCTSLEYRCITCLRNKTSRFTDASSTVRDNYKSKWWTTKLGGF